MVLSNSESIALTPAARRSHLLLMLYAPHSPLSLDALAAYAEVDGETVQQDLIHISGELRRIYRLSLQQQDNHYRIEGTELNKRLCLIEGLRRALRLCPQQVQRDFAPLQLQCHAQIAPPFNLPTERFDALTSSFAALLHARGAPEDVQILSFYLRYLLHLCAQRRLIEFNQHQLRWLRQKSDFQAVQTLFSAWPLPPVEVVGLMLLSGLLSTPHRPHSDSPDDQRLLAAVSQLTARFEQLSAMSFSQPELLSEQLFSHLSAALERCHFNIGIENSLQQEVEEKYPSLLRTTRTAIMPLEAAYKIRFPREEMGLIAVIFGAWLMQENDLQEKQVVILSKTEGRQEKMLELQLRELTLLPLNIKFQSVEAFQTSGAPKDTVLVITPFAMQLPLFSPPLMQVRLPLAQSQQYRIRKLLES